MTNSAIDNLLSIMARLRDPKTGCPWDIKQSFSSIAPYTIEEAYEVADAIERQDMTALKEELGDLLLQVVFHAQMAEEQGTFSFDDVVASIAEKLVRRHPHVFADKVAETSDAVLTVWEDIKSQERADKAVDSQKSHSVLDDIPLGLPALTRAAKLQKRMARVGFDWKKREQIIEKLEEEIEELKAEIAAGNLALAQEELGDVLFTAAHLANHLKTEPEAALRYANAKVVRRFSYIEQTLAADGKDITATSLAEMEVLWQEAKTLENKLVS